MEKTLQFSGTENRIDMATEGHMYRVDVRLNYNCHDKQASYFGRTPGQALGEAAKHSDNVADDVWEIAKILGITPSEMTK